MSSERRDRETEGEGNKERTMEFDGEINGGYCLSVCVCVSPPRLHLCLLGAVCLVEVDVSKWFNAFCFSIICDNASSSTPSILPSLYLEMKKSSRRNKRRLEKVNY